MKNMKTKKNILLISTYFFPFWEISFQGFCDVRIIFFQANSQIFSGDCFQDLFFFFKYFLFQDIYFFVIFVSFRIFFLFFPEYFSFQEIFFFFFFVLFG